MPDPGSEMQPAGGADRDGTHWTPWPTRSGAEVAFLHGEQAAAERIAQRFFHRSLEPWEYASLTGAPDDAKVEVGASGGALYLEMRDPAAAYRAYYYVRRNAAQLAVVNDGFCIAIRGLQRCGLGLRIFLRQFAAAVALQVARITVVAGRRHDENGYYTWPRFGFEALLPARLRRMLPIGLKHACTVLDLMECERGRRWWREYGVTIAAVFDLTVGSRSRIALWRYVCMKLNFVSGPKRNLENQSAMSYCNAR
jgi:hypothetical protein